MRSAIRIVAALAAAITFLTAAGSASARVVQSFGTAGADRLRFPDRIVYGPDGLLHVVDFGDAVRDPVFVRLYTPEGARAGGFRIAASEEFPPTIAVDAAGDTYVSQVGAVLKYSRAGALLARLPLPAQADGGPAEAIDLGVDPAGRLVVFDGDADRVDTYAPDGRLVARFHLGSAAPPPAASPRPRRAASSGCPRWFRRPPRRPVSRRRRSASRAWSTSATRPASPCSTPRAPSSPAPPHPPPA